MMNGIFITGSDTDIGKTFVSAYIAHLLSERFEKVAYYKPIQSGAYDEQECRISPDVQFVQSLNPHVDCFSTYQMIDAVSPHLAAEREAIQININAIKDTFTKLKNTYDYVIVEGAGGLFVPIIRGEYWITNLIRDLNMPALAVVEARVGSINQSIMTYACMKRENIKPIGIILNQFETNHWIHQDNLSIIQSYTGLKTVAGLPYIDVTKLDNRNLRKNQQTLDDGLLKMLGVLKIDEGE